MAMSDEDSVRECRKEIRRLRGVVREFQKTIISAADYEKYENMLSLVCGGYASCHDDLHGTGEHCPFFNNDLCSMESIKSLLGEHTEDIK
jgi:hypothetical protein